MRDFARWYDVMYAPKSYQQDATNALALVKEFNGSQDHLLELGAGTGNHTLQLAPFTKKITTIEIDSDMGIIGKEKTKHLKQVEWHLGPITSADKNLNVDVVMALFYVLNYVQTSQDLSLFFANIHSRMKKNAMFIFDCWNGDRQFTKDTLTTEREYSVDQYIIQQKISTLMRDSDQLTELNYDIHISDGKKGAKHHFAELIKIRRWTKEEIVTAASKTGFEVMAIRSRDNAKIPCTEQDSHLWFVLKKKD